MEPPTASDTVARATPRPDTRLGRTLLCGPITSERTMADVLTMLSVSGWSGELRVSSGAVHHRLTLDQGALKAAASDSHEHRLGELLVRRGLLSQVQLEQCLKQLGQGRRIGEVLVDKGWIEHRQLFDALRAQTERIFYDTLALASGRFVLTAPSDDAPAPPIAFHIPMTRLMLEAAQRSDEMRVYRTRISGGEVQPVLVCPAAEIGLDAQANQIAAQIDGQRTIHQIADRVDLDEHQVTRVVYALLERGAAAILEPSRPPARALVALIEPFEHALALVFEHAASPTVRAATQARVAEWIGVTGLSAYLGPELLPGGRIDRERLLAATAQLAPAQALASVYQALHDLTAFALLAVGSALPRQSETELTRDVYRRLRQIPAPPPSGLPS